MTNKKLDLSLVYKKTKQNNLLQITKANFWGNGLIDISLLAQMKKLKILSLSMNKIKKLDSLENLIDLEELYLRKNCIDSFEEVKKLKKLKNLKVLWLKDNPISS